MKHYCTKLFIRAMVLLKAIQTGVQYRIFGKSRIANRLQFTGFVGSWPLHLSSHSFPGLPFFTDAFQQFPLS